MANARCCIILATIVTISLLCIILGANIAFALKGIYEYVIVSGTIVNIYGQGLENVEIRVLNQYGGVITTVNTSSTGVFSIVLRSGSYLLEFIKRGYEYKKISLSIPGTRSEVDLGKIELKDGVCLVMDLDSISIEEFKSTSIKLTITNISPFEETCILHVTGPNDIMAYFKYNNIKISSIRVPSMGSKTVYLVVEPMGIGKGTYELCVMLNYSIGLISERLSVTVEEPEAKMIRIEHPIMRGCPGDVVSTWVTISNPFDIDLSLVVDVDVPSISWSYDILDQSGKAVSSITLSPNEKTKVKLKLYVPIDIQDGTYKVVLRISSLEYPIYDSKELSLMVRHGTPIIRMSISTPFLKGYPGSTVKYRMTLENVGDAEGLVDINISGLPNGFSYQIKDLSGNVVSKILIDAGKTETYLIEVQIPPDVEPTTFLMKIIATCLNNIYEEEIGLNILGKYDMKYVTENYFIKINAGDTGVFLLTVKNTGYNTLTDVKVNVVDYPSDFNVSVVPDRASEIKPGDSITFSIYIDIPPDMDSGDYYIIINVSSSQVSTEKRAIHVEVSQTSHALYYAIGILGIAICVLLIVYKLFGRR